MSKEGMLRRGQKWYNQRNRDGTLPKGIKNDPNKMCDVNYYLENKPAEKSPVISTKKKGGK